MTPRPLIPAWPSCSGARAVLSSRSCWSTPRSATASSAARPVRPRTTTESESVPVSHIDSVSSGLQADASDVRRKRLLFRCWHHGTQESDLILGPFAETWVAHFDSAQLDRFEALLDCWIVAVGAGGELYEATHAFIASPLGMLLLFLWSVAFFYHLCSGIRHLAWDAGYGFEIRDAYRSGYAVLAATALLTVLTWLYVALA